MSIMKNKRKIILSLSLICSAVMLLHTASATAAALLPEKEEQIYASSQQEEQKQAMIVCTSVLSIYGNTSLSGAPVATREKGDALTVSTSDGLIYKVYTTAGLLGYCHAGGLIYADTKTVAKVPFVWESYTYELPPEDSESPEDSELPDDSTDNTQNGTQTANTDENTDNGTDTSPDTSPDGPDTEEGEGNGGSTEEGGDDILPPDDDEAEEVPPITVTVTKYSDLVDVNEFAYSKGSILAISSKTVLVQRDLLKCLEIKCHALKGLGVSVSIENGYSLTSYSDPALQGCPVSSKSGALVKLRLKDGAGASLSPAEDTQVLELLADAGLVRIGESDWFYLESYEDYLTVNLSSSSLVYTIYG